VVATASVYATELLADGRGITVPFKDSVSVSSAINSVLGDPVLRASIETTAYRFGRSMTWGRVAKLYERAFRGAMTRRAHAAKTGGALEVAASKLWGDALTRRASSFGESISSN
jgi:hypothetical protein